MVYSQIGIGYFWCFERRGLSIESAFGANRTESENQMYNLAFFVAFNRTFSNIKVCCGGENMVLCGKKRKCFEFLNGIDFLCLWSVNFRARGVKNGNF